jgi:hypothetical protein
MRIVETRVANVTPAAPARWRIRTSRIMLLICCLSAVLSVPAIWVRNQIVDTDSYLRTVAPLASDPAIRRALTRRVTTLISSQVDDIVSREGLIDRDVLRVPMVMMIENYVSDTVGTIIGSEQFREVWERINRSAHPAVSALLTGRGTKRLSTDDGQVTLDLGPLIGQAIGRLRGRGLTIVDRIAVDRLDTSFVIYQAQGLASVQAGVSVLEQLTLWFPVLAAGSLAASLAFSVNRWQTALWGGLSVAAAMAGALIVLAFARSWSVDHLAPAVDREAATAFFETLGRHPRDAFRLLSLLGLCAAAVLFVTRPGSRLRRGQGDAWRFIARSVRARWPQVDEAANWSNAHLLALAVGVGVAACLLVIALDPLTVNQAMAVLIVTAIGYGGLWRLRVRKGVPAVAVAGLRSVFSTNAGIVAGDDVESGPPVVRTAPPPHTGTGDAWADLAVLASELPLEDLQLVRRLVVALRRP